MPANKCEPCAEVVALAAVLPIASERIEDLEKRVRLIEIRIAIVAGFAAAAGGLFGNLLNLLG